MKKVFFAIALASASLVAQAAPIYDLNNTGVATDPGLADMNYSVSWPDLYLDYGYGTANGPYPIGPWIDNTDSSQWLAPTGNQSDDLPAGTYDWTTTFDLTGFDPASASFSGRFAADNSAVAYLNGHQIGTSSGFTNWSSFASESGMFVAGQNTVEFLVTNTEGPSGLRVEFLQSSETTPSVTPAPVVAVPEPETYALMLAGLGALGYFARRRKAA